VIRHNRLQLETDRDRESSKEIRSTFQTIIQMQMKRAGVLLLIGYKPLIEFTGMRGRYTSTKLNIGHYIFANIHVRVDPNVAVYK
jgi:hypothetical protein